MRPPGESSLRGRYSESVDAGDLGLVLIPLLAETPAEAARAATLLGDSKDAGVVEVLTAALGEASREPRRELVLALGRVGGAEAAPMLAKELFHDSPEVRAVAAEALGRIGSAEHRAALKSLEQDYYRRVREAATAAGQALAGRTTAGGGKP